MTVLNVIPDSEAILKAKSLTHAPGVGKKLAEKLSKLGLQSVYDVLFFLPNRYLDRTRLTPLAHCQVGHYVVTEGEVVNCQTVFAQKRSLIVELNDNGDRLHCRFFHFSRSQQQSFVLGQKVRVIGEVRWVKNRKEIAHPEYTVLHAEQPLVLEKNLTPVYPSIQGLSQKLLTKVSQYAMSQLQLYPLQEWLSDNELSDRNWPTINASIQYLHAPKADANVKTLLDFQHPAQKRLQFEELVAQQLAARLVRKQVQKHQAPALTLTHNDQQDLLSLLPFTLTAAQTRVSHEIWQDMAQHKPMSRLLQGDVGSGKTVIALLAMLLAWRHGYQAALMVPTEILAEQHTQTLRKLTASFNISIVCLTGHLSNKDKQLITEDIRSGKHHLVIATHAVIQSNVQFHCLALCVVDEQHRFGVKQRLALMQKGQKEQACPHLLLMTATPIPRTLAMTEFADLDCSVIDELPPGRTPIQTVALPMSKRDDVIKRLQTVCSSGQQAYWVCTLIEESDALTASAAEASCERLKQALPQVAIGLLHGRMKTQQKEHTMQAFKQKEIALLVATSVIEVGVDVPNASLIVIENPERLGLAQLHQLRGRVGRGQVESFCVLLYQAPLSTEAKARLNILRTSSSGFAIAEEDLKIRGPGEWLGTQQAGVANLRIADVVRDAALLPLVQAKAQLIVAEQPRLCETLLKRWLPQHQDYAHI